MQYQPGPTLKDIEKETILGAYKFHQQNSTVTAKVLGISPRTLYTRLVEYGLKGLKDPEGEVPLPVHSKKK